MSARSISPLSPSAGALLGGKYLLVERIAEGGMGTLWRAVQRGLDREVAVKLVDMEEPGTEERVARILREAEICASVRHRYVVEVFDADTTSEGQPYIVMEFLRGETLAQRTARAPSMRVDDLVGMLARCLSGLEAVHEAGVVHRDLKPDNIILTEHREDGVVPKIVDFGISCRSFRLSRRDRRLTRAGTVIGTPWYMSPEQARAQDVIGPESDIYAMGVIAYEALTGRLPFDSDSLVALLLKITTEDAPPLSYYRPDLPVTLSDVVAKAMARAPADRFGTARAMRDALLAAVETSEPSFSAIVPSDGLMVLPDRPEPDVRPPAVVASSSVDSSRVVRARRGRLRVAAAATLSAALACAGTLHFAVHDGARDAGGAGPAPIVAASSPEAALTGVDAWEPSVALPQGERSQPSVALPQGERSQPSVALARGERSQPSVALAERASGAPGSPIGETSGPAGGMAVDTARSRNATVRDGSSGPREHPRRRRAPVAFRRLDF